MFVFNIISYIYSKCKSPFTPKSVMNKPQTEGRVNHVLINKSFLIISMVELDHQRSAANTLVNKMRLDIFVLFNIFNYCRFASYSEFNFTVLIHFDEY